MTDKTIPESFRDPSGWRPTPLQMSVVPETRGELPEKWLRRQKLYNPAAMAAWIAQHQAQQTTMHREKKPKKAKE